MTVWPAAVRACTFELPVNVEFTLAAEGIAVAKAADCTLEGSVGEVPPYDARASEVDVLPTCAMAVVPRFVTPRPPDRAVALAVPLDPDPVARARAAPFAPPAKAVPPVASAVAFAVPRLVLLAIAVASPPLPAAPLPAPIPPSPPEAVAEAVAVRLLADPVAMAFDVASPPRPPVPKPPEMLPPEPPADLSAAEARLLPLATAVDVLMASPPRPAVPPAPL